MHKQNELQKLLVNDPEIQEIKKKIEASYVSKERARQLAEKQVRTVEEKALQAEVEADMLKRQVEEERKLEERRKEFMARQK